MHMHILATELHIVLYSTAAFFNAEYLMQNYHFKTPRAD